MTLLGIIILSHSPGLYMAATGLFLAGFGLAGGFPVMVGIIGSAYKETTGTAIGIALFISLSGNTILNYIMGHISKAFEISSFPVFIIILLVLQAIIIFTNTKTINK
jgi:hypothetical protein